MLSNCAAEHHLLATEHAKMLIAHTDYAAYHAEKASKQHVDELRACTSPPNSFAPAPA